MWRRRHAAGRGRRRRGPARGGCRGRGGGRELLWLLPSPRRRVRTRGAESQQVCLGRGHLGHRRSARRSPTLRGGSRSLLGLPPSLCSLLGSDAPHGGVVALLNWPAREAGVLERRTGDDELGCWPHRAGWLASGRSAFRSCSRWLSNEWRTRGVAERQSKQLPSYQAAEGLICAHSDPRAWWPPPRTRAPDIDCKPLSAVSNKADSRKDVTRTRAA